MAYSYWSDGFTLQSRVSRCYLLAVWAIMHISLLVFNWNFTHSFLCSWSDFQSMKVHWQFHSNIIGCEWVYIANWFVVVVVKTYCYDLFGVGLHSSKPSFYKVFTLKCNFLQITITVIHITIHIHITFLSDYNK